MGVLPGVFGLSGSRLGGSGEYQAGNRIAADDPPQAADSENLSTSNKQSFSSRSHCNIAMKPVSDDSQSSTQRKQHAALIDATEDAVPVEPIAASQPAAFEDQLTEDLPELNAIGDASEGAKTVISHRPVAAPEEFYRTMPLAELAEMLEGRQLDHFAVEQMIGGGGMGAVFRGRDLRLDRVVAIKVIPASRRDPETLRRFRLEAQAAARLDHPNIARVFYVGEAERWNYIVFEFIDGVNMRDLVDMDGPLTIDDAVYYTRQVAEALEHARQREVVHRDIKPSNILVTATGHAKVVDMGLARDTSMDKSSADATASGVTLGTFDYISPEQARNPRDADVRSDLYSLGCSLFFMLTGDPPFPEGTALQKLLNHGSQPPPDPRGWRDDISDQLYAILLKLMAKRPNDRYQKPMELINDLVLLAEFEELQRSQSPGTYMISPSISQRTLLEANLPWMVAFAFLLGSTLWLQSVQSLSSEMSVPDIESVFPAPDSNGGRVEPTGAVAGNAERASGEPPGTSLIDALPSGVGGLPKNSGVVKDAARLPDGGLPVTPDSDSGQSAGNRVLASSELLVVSQEQPLDIAPMQWESSLARALQRLATDSVIKEIELRGKVLVDNPLVLETPTAVVRGNPAYNPVIEFASTAIETLPRSAASITLRDTQLQCSDLSIVVDVPPAPSSSGAYSLFALRGGAASLTLQRCVVTVTDSAASARMALVDARRELETGSSSPPTAALGSAAMELVGESPATVKAESRYAIVVQGCKIRGETVLVRLEDLRQSSRLDLTIQSSLIATSAGVLQALAANGSESPRFVRIDCSSSTFISQHSFASIEYLGEGSPLLGLHRTSQACIYKSENGHGHVQLRGARRQSLLGNFVLLHLQGQENAYDSDIHDICQCFIGNSKTATFGFTEASVDGWFDERGDEFEVLWENPLALQRPFHELEASDIVTVRGLFQPGYPRTSVLGQN